MKRVGFCGFKQFDAGRKVPPCLRLSAIDNVDHLNSSDCRETKCDAEHSCSCESFKKEECDCRRTKSNILSSIRKKWRRHKRGKRCECKKVLNLCHSHCCLNNQSLKNEKDYKTNENLGSTNPSNDSEVSNMFCDNVTQSADNENCSCFKSPTKKTFSNITAKLKARASRSMSDISAATLVSSPTVTKTNSNSDVYELSSLATCGTSLSYTNGLSMNSNENVISEDGTNSLGNSQKFGNLTQELHKLSKSGWYWGPINRSEAESKLVDQPDGSFLVRDSSDDRYILSLSFRSFGKTLHTRIEHSNGLFSFYAQPEPEGHASIVRLIQQSMCFSQSGVFCYSRSRSPGSPSYPVRLTKPISRFTEVRSLQYLCRFVIRQYTRYDHIQKLPLPSRIKGYLEEGPY